MFHDRYTEQMENQLFSQWDAFDSGEEDYSEVIAFLNSNSVFHSFGDGLLSLLSEKYPTITAESAIKHVEEACTTQNISTSEIGSVNTLKSWFKGGPRPKKGADSRSSMFALAFALKLTPDETARLFHKVYLDRAFDYRNEKELIYYHCLAHNKTWHDAQRLISQLSKETLQNEDETIYTSAIRYSADTFLSEEELLSFIRKHQHNFEKDNVSAREAITKLIRKAISTAQDEAMLPEHADLYRGSNRESVSFMYEVITGHPVSGARGTTTIFKNARLPKEIKNRFPEAGTFSKKAPTYEELRKMIILLFSYTYWYQLQIHEATSDIDEYIEELNAYLSNSGLPLLYFGNPFDWFFLYCNLAERPLDAFREILAEVLAK